MIELRLFRSRWKHQEGGIASSDGGHAFVLQYRTGKEQKWVSDDGLSGGADVAWSEWRDVPVADGEGG